MNRGIFRGRRSRSRARGSRVLFSTRWSVLFVGGLVATVVFGGSQAFLSHPGPNERPQVQRAPKHPQEIFRILDENGKKERFDGTVAGWRLGPTSALRAEGVADRNISRDCEPIRAGVETPTSLDFTLTYLPRGVTIETRVGPLKWVCDGEGMSVMYDFNLDTPYGVGDLWVERAIWGRRSMEVLVAHDRVEQGLINGKAAIFIHPADDSGIGQSQIMVIEDDTPPEFLILRLASGDGVSFSELIKVAEGVK